MSRIAVPSNVNIKNPLALQKIAEARNSGFGRNLSEAAENLILRGAESIQSTDTHPEPVGSTDARADAKTTTNAA